MDSNIHQKLVGYNLKNSKFEKSENSIVGFIIFHLNFEF
jgi:hypothetical protein